jgi:hypothetical protein
MEFTHLNQENLVNISFTDVIKIISSDDTTPEQKLVYIYLLNVIMDTNERLDKLQQTIDKFNSYVNMEEDYELMMERRGKPSTDEDEDEDDVHMSCPLCDGVGYFDEDSEEEPTDCSNCCGEGYVIFNEDEQDTFPDGKCIEDTISEDVKWYEDNVKGDGLSFDENGIPLGKDGLPF